MQKITAFYRSINICIVVLALLPALPALSQACTISTDTVTIGSGMMSIHQAGDGPTVVLLHGLFAQKEQWDSYVCQLAEAGYNVLAPDLPGFGASHGFSLSDYALSQQVVLLHGLMTQLSIEQVHIAGNSMGGAIAALWAEQHPHRVLSIAFIGAPMGVVTWSPQVQRAILAGTHPFMPRTLSEFDQQMELLFAQPPVFPDEFKKNLITDYRDSIEHYRQVWDIVNLDACLSIATGLNDLPALILWGKADAIFNIEGAAVLAQRLPHAQRVDLPNLGHLPMLEQAETTVRHYIEFLHHVTDRAAH